MTIDFTRPTALYGGSFDPVHEGHVAVMRAVRAALPSYQLVLVPAAQSPGKAPAIAPGALRQRWLSLVAHRENFLLWEEELDRGGTSYTVDTLLEAHRQGAQAESLYWVVGADAYNNFSHWKDPEKIRSLCHFAVLDRPGSAISLGKSTDLKIPIAPQPASSTAIRKGLGAKPPLVSGLPEEVKLDLERLIALSQNPYARKQE